MTPKQKASILYTEFSSRLNDSRIAKQCALIAVYEIMEITQTPVIIIDSNGIEKQHGWQNDSFWFNVKQEIEKL